MATNSYILIIVGIAAIIIELFLGAATGFDLLVIGLVCIAAGVAGVITQSFTVSLAAIIVLSLLYVLLGRRLLKNSLVIHTKKTNIDGILGKKGIVTKPIRANRPGQVKVEGEVWRAQAEQTIEEDREVLIKSVSGITLLVEGI